MRFIFVEKIWAVRRVGHLMDEIQLHGKSKEVVDELVRLSRKYGIMTPYTSFLADERTLRADKEYVRHRALGYAGKAAGAISGPEGQSSAEMRLRLRTAKRAPAAAAPPGHDDSGVVLFGSRSKDGYEADRAEVVKGVRAVGNKTLYRYGRLWATAGTAGLHPARDADKIKTVSRFSEEYFELVRLNTVAENQILASQQDDEELLIKLRGQVYLIK